MKLTWIPVCCALFTVAPVYAGESAELPFGASLPAMLDWLDQHHPEIQAMQQESLAAMARVTPAGALPDPMFRMELQDIDRSNPTLAPNKVGSTKYSFIQSLPWWGKRDLQRGVAESEAKRVGTQVAQTRNELRARLKVGYAQFFYSHTAARVNQELAEIAARLEQVAQTRYANGLAPQQDALKAQLEKTSLSAERLSLASEIRQVEARLNVLLLRPVNAQLTPPLALPGLDKGLPSADLASLALQRNPQIQSQNAQIESAQASRKLADSNRYPDFALGIAPIQTGNRVEKFEVMLEMNLPLRWDVRNAQRDEAGAMLAAAESRKNAAEQQLRGDIEEARSAYLLAQSQQQLLSNTLLPQAQLTFRSALAGYENGKVDFTTVLDSIRQIRQLRLDLARNQKEQLTRQAELEKWIGEEL